MYGSTGSKSMDQQGKVANPARGQLNRENVAKSMDQPDKVVNPARGQLNGENKYFPFPVRASEFGLFIFILYELLVIGIISTWYYISTATVYW